MRVKQVWSDNFDGSYLTIAAYHELRLIMSTGDFHCHTCVDAIVNESEVEVISLDDLIEVA